MARLNAIYNEDLFLREEGGTRDLYFWKKYDNTYGFVLRLTNRDEKVGTGMVLTNDQCRDLMELLYEHLSEQEE